jgi:hypothetical protein
MHHQKATMLMTAATDGHLVFWVNSQAIDGHDSQEMTCVKTQALHQSSIKSLSTCKLNDGTTLIVTGGDDNGLGLALISFENLKDLDCSTLIIPRTHAAAVTAANILTCQQNNVENPCFHIQVATASNDQRVKLWDLDINLGKKGVEGLEVKRVANRYTAVADVSSMALFPAEDGSEQAGTRILICGVGMEVWVAKVQ